MTKQEWAEIAETLSAVYGAHRFNVETLKIWYRFLQDMPADAVQAGIEATIRSSRYPTVADIREDFDKGQWIPPSGITTLGGKNIFDILGINNWAPELGPGGRR